MIREAIDSLVRGESLTPEIVREVAFEMLEGNATPAQIGAFVTALRIRGESAGDLRAFAEAMRQKAARLSPPSGVVLDTCGTGGDHCGTFNISTTAAFVAAGAGVMVAKHGNRGATSRCGSADVLEALGIRVDLTAAQAEECLHRTGMCFLFAPAHHSAMRHAAGPRKEIGIRTIFNLLGPLANPAGATHQLIGVFDGALTEMYAEALAGLGSQRALVVHGEDGLDEITTTAPSKITELIGGAEGMQAGGPHHNKNIEDKGMQASTIVSRYCTPQEFGLSEATREELAGGDAVQNAEILANILQNKATRAQMEIVLLNSGAALYVAGKAASIGEGVALADSTIRSGAAWEKVQALKECSKV